MQIQLKDAAVADLSCHCACRYVNNQREHYEFRFNGTLAAEAKQDEVLLRTALSAGGLTFMQCSIAVVGAGL